jgi:putative sigma-54 modulation protein
MMKTNVKATNITLTPAITDYIDKRIDILNKYFREDEEVLVNVEVGKSTQHHKSGDVFRAEIQVDADQGVFYAAIETEDLYSSIDQAKDQMARELSSDKKKSQSLLRRGGAKIKNILKGIWRKNS